MNGNTIDQVAAPAAVLSPMRTRRWLRWVLLFVIFVSGFIVGGFAAGVAIRNKVLETINHPDTVPPRVAARLRRVLGLNDEQTKQVTAILEERRQAIQSIRLEFQPRIEAELEEARTGISAVLNDTQRERWQRYFTEMQATWLPPATK